MIILSRVVPAGPGERFSTDAARSFVGIPVTFNGRNCGRVTDAQVTDSGWVVLIMEIEDSERRWVYGGTDKIR